MKKKILALMLATAMLGGLCAGCSPTGAKNQEKKEVTEGSSNNTSNEDVKTVRVAWLNKTEEDKIDPVTGIVSPGKGALEDLLSEKTGHNVEIIPVASNGWIQQVETLVISGECDVLAYTNQTQVPSWCEELTPYIEADEKLGNGGLEEVFIEYARHYMKYSSFEYPDAYGNIYGLPHSMNQSFIAYDTLIFEQWGVEPPKDGATFEELLEIGKKVTGTNPVTGEQNYGMYLRSDRAEFAAIAFDAYPSVDTKSGNINDFDVDKYVEPLKGSEELLAYFQWMEEVVKICPEGITTNSGNELWLSPENNIAINITPLDTMNLMNTYYRVKDQEVIERFQYLNMPTSSEGMQGFPVMQNMGISINATDKDAAWDVVRTIATDAEVVDYLLMNYSYGFLPVLEDISALTFVEDNPTVTDRYEFQKEHGFITDDYWFFRTPIQSVISEVLAKKISPEEARDKTYEEINKWVENMKALTN